MCCVLELVTLKGEKKISSHTHKTGSRYLLGVLFKISDEQPPSFLYGSPPGIWLWLSNLKYIVIKQRASTRLVFLYCFVSLTSYYMRCLQQACRDKNAAGQNSLSISARTYLVFLRQ